MSYWVSTLCPVTRLGISSWRLLWFSVWILFPLCGYLPIELIVVCFMTFRSMWQRQACWFGKLIMLYQHAQKYPLFYLFFYKNLTILIFEIILKVIVFWQLAALIQLWCFLFLHLFWLMFVAADFWVGILVLQSLWLTNLCKREWAVITENFFSKGISCWTYADLVWNLCFWVACIPCGSLANIFSFTIYF